MTGIVYLFWIFPKPAENSPSKRTKIILSLIALVLFIFLLATTARISNPNFGRENAVVTITPVAEVYKSNIDADDLSHYYIAKEGDVKIYELEVNNVSSGTSNYVITKKFDNGDVTYELVLKDKNAIKKLPKL